MKTPFAVLVALSLVAGIGFGGLAEAAGDAIGYGVSHTLPMAE